MPDHPSPVAAELAEARELTALPDPVQLDLIADAVPGRDPGTVAQLAERRGRGRPPGALNKRNGKFREQLLAMCNGVHPALVLARTTTTPVEQLAAVLACSRAEAFGFQMRAAAELLPYLEGKQPVQVEISRRADVVLIMPAGAQSPDQLEQLAADVNDGMAEGIDWASAEIVDVLPSLSGTPLQSGSPLEAEQSGSAAENGGSDASLRP